MLFRPQGIFKGKLMAVSILLIGAGIFLLAYEYLPSAGLREVTFLREKPAEIRGPILSKSAPKTLSIPAINVKANFVELGVDKNNQIEIPKNGTDVGWYKYGPTPGELGPAIVLGHVDWGKDAGVFYLLGQLKAGDEIQITREDGSIAKFKVDSLDRYEQDNFPTSLVYGDIDHAGLRLITCSGSYDRFQKRYDKNLVVYASLVE